MDYEKKYKEALERAKQFSEKPYLEDSKGIVEYIFPELKESEDERIRKEILDCFRAMKQQGCFPSKHKEQYDSWIAWLEKQGEQILANSAKTCKDEQKPADKVEPKFHEGDMIIHKELGGDYIHNPHKIIQVDILDKKYRLEGGLVAHFGEQDDYELVEQNPAWSDEDEKKLNYLIALLQNSTMTNVALSATNEGIEDFLKSLKNRVQPQPKQELSEEDEYLLDETIKHLEALIRITKKQGSAYSDEIQYYKRDIDWLKSLKDRYTWKPSSEQIEAIRLARSFVVDDFSEKPTLSDILVELEKQLKKL